MSNVIVTVTPGTNTVQVAPSIAVATGRRGKGIASTAWDSETGILTITYTDASTETLILSGLPAERLANVATNTIIGRVTAGSGSSEQLTPAQTRALLNVEDGATGDQTGAEIKAAYEAEDDTNAFTDAEKAKIALLTVTQGVDLDAMELRINQLDAAVVLQGTWDASSGTFPGAGSAQAGHSWIVSVGGTVDGVEFAANDRIIALADNAPTSTYSGNWHKADYTDAVLSIAGKTGVVTLQMADITDLPTLGTAAEQDVGTDPGDVVQLDGEGKLLAVGGISMDERDADPADPTEGKSVIWQSDGTDSGDDGDIMMKITAGGVTKTTRMVGSSSSQAGAGSEVNNIVMLTQASYDALGTPDPNTVYLVTAE